MKMKLEMYFNHTEPVCASN